MSESQMSCQENATFTSDFPLAIGRSIRFSLPLNMAPQADGETQKPTSKAAAAAAKLEALRVSFYV